MKSSRCAFAAWCCMSTSPNIATHFVHPSHLFHVPCNTNSPHKQAKTIILTCICLWRWSCDKSRWWTWGERWELIGTWDSSICCCRTCKIIVKILLLLQDILYWSWIMWYYSWDTSWNLQIFHFRVSTKKYPFTFSSCLLSCNQIQVCNIRIIEILPNKLLESPLRSFFIILISFSF